MPEYCCRTGKPMGLIDCDRCPDRNAYNRNLRDGLKINEAGWVAPDNYEHHENGRWRFVNWNVKTRRAQISMPEIKLFTVKKYMLGKQEYNTAEELKEALYCAHMERSGIFDGVSESRSQNDEIRSVAAKNMKALAEIFLGVNSLVDELADPSPSGEGQ